MKRLSENEMFQIVLERVPLEERLKSVYVPIIAMGCALYLVEDLLSLLRTVKFDKTKKSSRIITEASKNYVRSNNTVMTKELQDILKEKVDTFYSGVSKDLTILGLQYAQALLDKGLQKPSSESMILNYAYTIKVVVSLITRMDREFSKRISDILGKDIVYKTEDDGNCIRLLEGIDKLILSLDAPLELDSSRIELATKIVTIKLNNLNIV